MQLNVDFNLHNPIITLNQLQIAASQETFKLFFPKHSRSLLVLNPEISVFGSQFFSHTCTCYKGAIYLMNFKLPLEFTSIALHLNS